MQNRYAGDVGDFIKLGLLRHLEAADLSFGVNWYLTPDEAHNADGKHVAYVEPGNRQHASLEACDPDLMQRLRGVVGGSRSVQALEDSGVLPVGALTFGEVLDRSVDRRAWHERALAGLVSADAVFVDPDNGVASASGRPRFKRRPSSAELLAPSDRCRSARSSRIGGRAACLWLRQATST
jgi:hypothetical protein